MNRCDFMSITVKSALGLSAVTALQKQASAGPGNKDKRPNIIIVMVDDMGYSDIGCYGGEINTPNLNKLSEQGIRFSQFYNCAKCGPTRASLLTGLYTKQTGQGLYNCVTFGEAMRTAGYTTLMTGKWHNGGSPDKRGFDRYFGINSGKCRSYFSTKKNYWLDDKPFTTDDKRFYATDAFTDYAIKFIDEAVLKPKPFLLYIAYNAPHYPLHAWPEDIAKYKGKYMKGWEEIRKERYKRMIKMGLIDKKWILSERDTKKHLKITPVPLWDEVEDKEAWDLKMAVYAAMVDRMDQNIGKLVKKLKELKIDENTLILFLSDNGGCPFERNQRTEVPPGPGEGFHTVDAPWANTSNTPFRMYKQYSHEGGTATPLIAYWPAVIKKHNTITNQVGHVIDIMATCIDLGEGKYPTEFNGQKITPLEGKSLAPVFRGQKRKGHDVIFWEFADNKAVRQGKWKIVSEGTADWELYDMDEDRTELNNQAEKMPEKIKQMVQLYDDWEERCKVIMKTWKERAREEEKKAKRK